MLWPHSQSTKWSSIVHNIPMIRGKTCPSFKYFQKQNENEKHETWFHQAHNQKSMMMMINLVLKSRKLQINTMSIHATIECISNTKWNSTKLKSFEDFISKCKCNMGKNKNIFENKTLKLDVSPMKLSTSILC
jgi:hypothetical protein